MKLRLERVGIVAAMAVATLTVWTGGPLLGLWIGSRVAGPDGLSMAAVFTVAATVALVAFLMLRVLAALNAAYDRVTGRPPARRRQEPWLRAMSGARPHAESDDQGLSALEVVLVCGVVLCYLAFEVWFFFFAGASI